MEVSLELERTIARKFQEAHDASKASIQSRISNLESGGVKGTGNAVHRSEIDEVIKIITIKTGT